MSNKSNIDYNESIKIIKKYPPKQRYTLAILQDIQKEYSFIPRQSLELLSKYIETKLSKLYSMATFYKALSLKPKGKYIIKVCDGTACHIRGSRLIIEEIEKKLNISAGETTKDGKFSLETVNCLGSCALAPVVVINNKYYGKVTPDKINQILSNYEGVQYAEK